LLGALEELRSELDTRGAPLVVRRGDPVREAIALAREVEAEAIHLSGNWQWVAGVGVDTRSRGFNAERKAERFDSDGRYATA
jgi:deoxyribodipyrimidine photolyase